MAAEYEDEQSESEILRDIEQEASQTDEAEGQETYSLEPDEDEDEDGDDEPRLTRKEKRRNRYAEAQRRADEAERRAQEAERRAQELARIAAERRETPRAPEPREDPHQAEIDRMWREQRLLYQEIEARSGSMTREEVAEYDRKVREATEGYHRAIARQEAAKAARGGDDPGRLAAAAMAAQHPDVYGNDRALAYAKSYYEMQRARGRPANQEVFQEALQAARRDILGHKGKPAPRPRTSADKARYAGSPRAGRGEAPVKRSFTMTKEDRNLADALYSHIKDPVARRKMFARSVGKDLIDSGER